MKTPAFVGCMLALLLAGGCGRQPADSSTAAKEGGQAAGGAEEKGGSPLTAPVDYLGAVAKAHQTAIKTVDVASIGQAIQLFNAEHGRNPKDLNELVTEKFLPKIPAAPAGMKIVYDAASGAVKVVKE
jgi:hypothetical protein